MTVVITMHCSPELKSAIGEAADADGVPMNEWIARVCAKALKRPELASIPRKALGRPRKEIVLS